MTRIPIYIAASLFVMAIAILAIDIRARARGPGMVHVEPAERNLGNVRPIPVGDNYKITNELTTDIKIVGIVKSCGCTTAALDNDVIRTGQSTVLRCRFDLSGRAGDFASHITVLYRPLVGAGRQGTIDCVAYATVIPTVQLSIPKLIFHTDENQLRVGIHIVDGKSKITGVASNHRALSAELAPDVDAIVVTFNRNKWTQLEGVPYIEVTTNCPGEETIRIPVIVSNHALSPSVKQVPSKNL